jgi:signal transduction histidine kinase
MKDKLALSVKDNAGAEPFELTERKGPNPNSPPTYPPSRASGFALFNLSIKRRLPLFIGLLLSGMLAVSTWAAYRGMKETALEAGRERLRLLTQQLASMFQQSFTNVSNRTATAANDAVMRGYLLAPATRPQAEMPAVLRPFIPPQDTSSLRVELWNVKRALVQAWPASSAPMAADLETEFRQAVAAPPFCVVGVIRSVNQAIAYPIVAAVKNPEGQPIGYLVRWRKVAATAEARQQFVDLLGTQAAIYLGNRQGDLWSDLVKVAAPPPVDVRSSSVITQYKRERDQLVLALARPINGTPWFVLVEFSDQPILAQAKRFLRRMTVIGLVLLVFGLSIAVGLSYRITRPLDSLTKAAVDISNGNYSRLVNVHSHDELGILAQTFNTMAAKVQNAQHELEMKVHDRTLQLQAANKELEAFSYSVSHDLRAPLRHINGFSQALLEDYADQLDEVGKGYLQEVRGASQEMAQLIDDLLQLARVTRSELRREPVNLSQLAEEVTAELQRSAVERAVTVKIEAGLMAQGDTHLLRVVLSNLLGNAWKFTSKRELAEIIFGQDSQSEDPTYFVRDNGAGFEMAYVNKLFGAFQRLHSAGDFEGTGIGLATVQRVIHRHGGRVWAEGRVNHGATFYFTLPNARKES